MIILWVRALHTDPSKERTSERFTQIPLLRAKTTEMSCAFFYHIYLIKSLFRYLDPVHLKQMGLGSGSARDVRTPSVFERHASWG